MSETTDCQRNNDVILNRAKDYYKNDKERLRDKKQKTNTKIYQRKKIKRENMEEIDIILCLKNRNKTEGVQKKLLSNKKVKENVLINLIINISSDSLSYSLSDSADELESKSSSIRFSVLVFFISYLHFSRSV